ncbi:MAG: translocation/assembly module TamB domain-containing protein [Saprospiraceae bacterium]|nr:translocation/assembly module TamB domain-containing protein [Saprospiraceae bacterium]
MDVKVTSLKGTKFNIPVTYEQVATESKFVKFSSRTVQVDSVIKPIVPSIIGLNMNMQLTITEDADISIIFDELAGDILRGTGRGNLSIKSLRTGLFTVSGLYEVEQGEYLFTLYNFVNKPFAIARGGTINWTGDPLNATIQLEAVYEGLSTSPYILIQEYLAADQRLIEEAKRRTEVKLKMLLTGSLLLPDIRFDIDMPDLTGQLKNFADNKIRYLRTNQDQLNQQVFGLLVLRTFLNSFDPTEIGSNLSTTTINTMSEMLSNQFSLFVTSLLSNAFDDVNFISGVDFNIGYDFDNTIPGSSKFNEGEVVFSLKHRLWNDQWIVTLGGNYKSSSSSIYGNSYFNPESIIEWNTPVPGLKLRIYYRGDESIEGLKHKIGTGISYRKEFDSFFDFKKELNSKAKTRNKNSIE